MRSALLTFRTATLQSAAQRLLVTTGTRKRKTKRKKRKGGRKRSRRTYTRSMAPLTLSWLLMIINKIRLTKKVLERST
jgi:hypothetical protein